MNVRILGLLLLLWIAACAPSGRGPSADGVAAPPSPPPTAPPPVQTPRTSPTTPPIRMESASAPDTYWVTNPSSGARLYVQLVRPTGGGTGPWPTLLLVPGGTGTIQAGAAQRLAREGFLVVVFDPDGRGRSQGSEDYNGFVGQDGLAAVARAAATLPEVDTDRFGIVSYSYGVTMATGALARHSDLPVDFYIDWEGPVSRFYTTVGCTGTKGNIQWQPCSNDAWWAEREALTFIGQIRLPYQRIQSQKDHVQPENRHAIEIVNAAVAAGLPWVRLNDNPPNQTYDPANPPAMLPEAQDKRLEEIIAEYARYIIENVLR